MKKMGLRLIVLLIAFSILTGLILFKGTIIQFVSPRPDKPFSAVASGNIISLLVQNEASQTTIYKKNARWYLTKGGQEFRADENRVNKLIDAIVGLKKDAIVSTNKNKHGDFGIGQKKIVIGTKTRSYVLYIGNLANSSENYVRVDNENEVFVSPGFDSAFSPEDYRDLLVHLIDDEEKINLAQINFDGRTVILKKNDNDWSENGTKAKRGRVDFFLNDLMTLKAADIFTQNSFGQSLTNPTLTIQLRENTTQKTAEFFPKDKNGYFAKTSYSDLVFQIPAAYVESLKKEEKDFTQD